MLITLPSFFINLSDLLDKESLKLIRKSDFLAYSGEMQNIKDQLDSYTDKSNFDSYVIEQIKKHRSHILILALKNPELYTTLRAETFKIYWDEYFQTVQFLNTEQYYKPYPHLHSMDMLISNYLYNQYSNFQSINKQKSFSFLAHAATYGRLHALDSATGRLIEYINANPDLIDCLRSLLDKAITDYSYLGHRLAGYRYIQLSQKTNDTNYLEMGIKNYQLADNLEKKYQILPSKQFAITMFGCPSHGVINELENQSKESIIKYNADGDGSDLPALNILNEIIKATEGLDDETLDKIYLSNK